MLPYRASGTLLGARPTAGLVWPVNIHESHVYVFVMTLAVRSVRLAFFYWVENTWNLLVFPLGKWGGKKINATRCNFTFYSIQMWNPVSLEVLLTLGLCSFVLPFVFPVQNVFATGCFFHYSGFSSVTAYLFNFRVPCLVVACLLLLYSWIDSFYVSCLVEQGTHLLIFPFVGDGILCFICFCFPYPPCMCLKWVRSPVCNSSSWRITAKNAFVMCMQSKERWKKGSTRERIKSNNWDCPFKSRWIRRHGIAFETNHIFMHVAICHS